MRAAAQLKSGHIQTGSTITMQVAKNYFPPMKEASRKINEILLALQIERQLTKDEILELVNKIYLGTVPMASRLPHRSNTASRSKT